MDATTSFGRKKVILRGQAMNDSLCGETQKWRPERFQDDDVFIIVISFLGGFIGSLGCFFVEKFRTLLLLLFHIELFKAIILILMADGAPVTILITISVMVSRESSGNSTRLSMDVANLPLTPFGMKHNGSPRKLTSPATNRLLGNLQF
ncbi:hypothetical protein E2C01_008217 [Portunus trituberculatus]|uniref:Uncharacterized protein n=1 Tax=Portunus trituberculatus TaxID=210409 RepID=A0A5B7D276_PORTR|nr:hypothetical protein [Portunus trituberculatus]